MTGNSANTALDKEFLKQLENSNAPPEMLAFYGSKVMSDDCVVFQDAQEALSVFLDCRPDYEMINLMVGATRNYRGVNRCELESVINMRGISRKNQSRLFSQIKLIEGGALKGFREQQKAA
jgi:hypothetical protein